MHLQVFNVHYFLQLYYFARFSHPNLTNVICIWLLAAVKWSRFRRIIYISHMGMLEIREWDWELVGLCIPTEDCLCPPVGSATICGLNKHS